jgi:subtilisin family serine protease
MRSPISTASLDLGVGSAIEYAQQVDPKYWPRVLIAVSETADLGIFARSWPSSDSGISDRFTRFGILELPLPPETGFAEWLAQRDGVDAVFASETPIRMIEPADEINAPMDQAKGIVNLPSNLHINPHSNARIGILDTGLDLAHPDFPVISSRWVRDFTDEGTPLDYNGHGTHVAGIVAGTGAVSDGRFAGIAPGAELLVAKVLESDGHGALASILDALVWANNQDVDVLNISLGAARPSEGESLLSRACRILAQSGIIICAAAGNEGPGLSTVGSPADAQGVIAVGAIDGDKILADFSSRGTPDDGSPLRSKPDCVAPGVGITSARSSHCERGDDPYYVTLRGTSMACPVVAGSAALLISELRSRGVENPRLKAKQAILAGTVPLQVDGRWYLPHEVGSGLIDVQKAVESIGG